MSPKCQQDVYFELPAEAEGGPECAANGISGYMASGLQQVHGKTIIRRS